MKHALKEQKDILVVEDEYMFAMDADDALTAIGYNAIIATNVTEALQVLKENAIAAAVVDYNLGDGTSLPVVAELEEKDIPFSMVSGATIAELKKAVGEDCPIYRKPVDYDQVAKQLAKREANKDS